MDRGGVAMRDRALSTGFPTQPSAQESNFIFPGGEEANGAV